jgi:hypothetical protein
MYSREYMSDNQFGFRPPKITAEAAMAIKTFVQESLDAELIALVSLDVQGAFDAAWWPGIMRKLKEYKCPKNLYKLTTNYFTQRTAAVATNSVKVEKTVTRGWPGFLESTI